MPQCKGYKVVSEELTEYCQLERKHAGPCRFDSTMAHPQSIASAVTIHATFPAGTKRQAIVDWIAAAPGAQRISKLPSSESTGQ